MKPIAIARSVVPLLVLAVLALAPQSANACVITYVDVFISDYDVSATGFVGDYYNAGECFNNAYYQWGYWEHTYIASVVIQSPTRSADDGENVANVPYGGGGADVFADLSTTGELGVYNIAVAVVVYCTIGGEFAGEEETQQRNLPPRPINFREKMPGSGSFGTLHFEYEWDSSSGSLADLANCRVGESVAYPNGNPFNWPNPPYGSSTTILQTPNPFVKIDVRGDDGQLQDNHQLPTQFYPAAQQQANNFTANQLYMYTCPGINNGGSVALSGSDASHIIGREVVNENGWKYKLSKGITSTYNIPN